MRYGAGAIGSAASGMRERCESYIVDDDFRCRNRQRQTSFAKVMSGEAGGAGRKLRDRANPNVMPTPLARSTPATEELLPT